jgi:hypothetical protein
MHLSTSNSEIVTFEITTPLFNYAIGLFMMVVLVLCLCVELGTRYGFHRISRIQQRIHREKIDFLALHSGAFGAPRNVAIVGNSLLLYSVDVPLLNKLGSGKFNYSRLVVEQTQYLDWYFGLKRLLGEGAHPDALVLLLGANHWLADAVRGEYFAYELMRPLDVFSLARELNLDRTALSNYFFASLSAWLGSRVEIRKFILSHVITDLQDFVGLLNTEPPIYPVENIAFDKARKRMVQLKTLCESYGIKLT